MNATLPIPAASPASNGATLSPVEFVRAMSPEDKEDVFILLVQELIAMNGGNGMIPFENLDGQFLGYFVPPAAAKELADKQWAEMPASVRERLSRPVKDLDNCISADEMLAHLRQAVGSTTP